MEMEAVSTLSFGERFRQWRQSKNLSAYRIAKLVGVHPSFISNIESGRRPMSEALMHKIAAIAEFDIAFETLQAWQIATQYAPESLHQAYHNSVNAPKSLPQNMTPVEGLYRIPLKMVVHAGTLSPKQELEDVVYMDWYGLQTVSTDLFCMRVEGDSMWPPIPDGAILLVREVDALKNGEKYVIETEDEQMTFKLIRFDNSGAYLVPLNPQYAPIPLGQARLKRLFQVLSYKVDWS